MQEAQNGLVQYKSCLFKVQNIRTARDKHIMLARRVNSSGSHVAAENRIKELSAFVMAVAVVA